MFRPGEIEGASRGIEQTFSDMELRIMDDIVRRIRINGEITRSADWQIHRLHELGASDMAVRGYIQNCLEYSEREMDELYYDVLRKGYYRDGAIYRQTGDDQIPFEENAGLQQLISAVSDQTSGEMKNITQSLGFAVRENGRLRFLPIADYYQRTLDGAMFDIASGAFDYNTVLRRVTKEMTNSGLRTVDYASGRSIRVESAARMCVMTGFSQLTAKINEQNADALGTEYFEVTYHGGARPEHQEWQGKVYTKDELYSVCGLGAPDGLCGCNCYHDYFPFFPGISERAYTDEELDKMNREENTPKEYHGREYTAYQATQRQRSLERSMRAQRQQIHLLQTGGADDEEIMLARGKYRALSSEYTHFSKAMGIPQQRERVTVDGLGDVGKGKYTETDEPAKIPSLGSRITDHVTQEERRELLTRGDKTESRQAFANAESIEEAEQFALANGIRHVDYSDLPLETANLLNEAAMTLPEDIRPAFIGSGKSIQKVTGAKFTRKEKDYYGVHVDVLQMHFGEYPNVVYDFEGGQCVGISSAYKNIEKIQKSKESGNKKYSQSHDGHTQFFNTDGRSTAFHEMGHVYADKKGIPDGFEEDAKRWFRESKCDMLKSTSEAWAEAWGAYHTKNPDLPDYIAKYIEAATNTPVDKNDGSGIIEAREKTRVNIQLFAERDIEKQETGSLIRAMRKYEKRIEEHEGYIRDPKSHCPDWDSFDERQKAGLIKHWNKEISNFKESIDNRIEELKKRGEYYE